MRIALTLPKILSHFYNFLSSSLKMIASQAIATVLSKYDYRMRQYTATDTDFYLFPSVGLLSVVMMIPQIEAQGSSRGCHRLSSVEFNALKKTSSGTRLTLTSSHLPLRTLYAAQRPADPYFQYSMLAKHGSKEGDSSFVAIGRDAHTVVNPSQVVIRAQFDAHKFITMLMPARQVGEASISCTTTEPLVKNMKPTEVFMYDVAA